MCEVICEKAQEKIQKMNFRYADWFCRVENKKLDSKRERKEEKGDYLLREKQTYSPI